VARRAYADRSWQEAQRDRLRTASARLLALLGQHGLADAGGTTQFRLVETVDAAGLFEHLCAHGILVRPFTERSAALRFGIPGCERDWSRLTTALTQWNPAP
jgi:cobalamin biosynthetic protein CobC